MYCENCTPTSTASRTTNKAGAAKKGNGNQVQLRTLNMITKLKMSSQAEQRSSRTSKWLVLTKNCLQVFSHPKIMDAKRYLDKLLERVAPAGLVDLRIPFKRHSDPQLSLPFAGTAGNVQGFSIGISLRTSYANACLDPVACPFARLPGHPFHKLNRLYSVPQPSDSESAPQLRLNSALKGEMRNVRVLLSDLSFRPKTHGHPPEFQRCFYELIEDRRGSTNKLKKMIQDRFNADTTRQRHRWSFSSASSGSWSTTSWSYSGEWNWQHRPRWQKKA